MDSDNYKLFAADIRKTEEMESKMKDYFQISGSAPTFILTECLLCYLLNSASEKILKWANTYFADSKFLCLLNFEMIDPHDSFGQTMV